tara:strand:- start:3625 stop:5283 length:1659 start_codon:yes stop_codon:yes gene_type:complete
MASDAQYTGDGSKTAFNITFPFLKSTDIKVQLAGVNQSVSTFSISGTTLTFDTAPTDNTAVRIHRVTAVDKQQHEFSAGSSITAHDLNENQQQAIYALEEVGTVAASGDGLPLTTGSKTDIYVNSANSWTINDNAVDAAAIAANSVGTAELIADSVTGTELANNIVIPDANSIRFGTDSDMSIYHNGTSGVITNTTGDLYLWGNGSNNVDIRAKNDEHSIVCRPNAETELYHNGNEKFQTSSTGVTTTGTTHSTTGFTFGGTTSYLYESANNAPTLRIGVDGPYLKISELTSNADIKIENLNGNLLFDSSGGTTTINDNLSVSGVLSVTGAIAPYQSSGDWWGHVPYITTAGVIEIGQIIDFHTADTNTADWDLRIGGITNPHRASNATEVVLGYKTAGDWGQFLRNEQRNCHNFRWVQSGSDDWFEVVCDDAGAGGSNGANQVRGIADYASDINLKENIIDSTYDALGCIKNIKLRSFDWNTAKSGRTGNVKCGVIAQEIETVNSDLITTLTDGTKNLNPSKIITVSLKAIQDLISKVETLEAKVAALEST